MKNLEKSFGVPRLKTSEEISKLEKQRSQYERTVRQDADSPLKRFINDILGKGSITAAEIRLVDAKHEDELRSKVEVGDPNLVNAKTLSVQHRFTGPMSHLKLCATGYINGKEIKIIEHHRGDPHPAVIIEGKEVDDHNAKAIYEKYFQAALERAKKLNKKL